MNGSIIDAGRYEDIVHGHDVNQQVGFNFKTHVDLVSSIRRHDQTPGLVEIEIPRPSQLGHSFASFRINEYLTKMRRSKRWLVSVEMDFLPEPPFGPTLCRLQVDIDGLGSASFTRTTGETRVQHWRVYLTNIPKRTMDLVFPPWSFLPWISERLEEAGSLPSAERNKVLEFAAASSLAFRDIQAFLTDLRLLGPFRTPPERLYTFSGCGALDTGTTGERAIDLLITEKLVKPKNESLRKAVSFWLKRLGLAKAMTIQSLAKDSNIFELSIAGAGTAKTANYADVGFGISQVLPVLVQGFLVPRNGTYIVQQPEIHLHPDAQAALADFFLYLASHGIRSIVETHSEYLLLRLRRRLAEGVKRINVGLPREFPPSTAPIEKNQVAVVMVGDRQDSAELNQLEIGPSFQFENLPKVFMDQSISDRLALLKALRK